MIDIHAHVLPGLDDGAADMDEAVAMCRMAHDDGVRCIVATPHFHRGLFETPSIDRVRELRARLQQRCRQDVDAEFRVLLGSDCHVHAEILENLQAGRVPAINDGHYVLVELPEDRVPLGVDRLFFQLRLAGFRPVITHPERNAELARDPEQLQGLVEQGCYAQVTAGSLTGDFGADIQTVAIEMLARHLVQVVASDSHDTVARPPLLTSARGEVADVVGLELADRMFTEIPRAMIEDRDFDFPSPIVKANDAFSFWRRLFPS